MRVDTFNICQTVIMTVNALLFAGAFTWFQAPFVSEGKKWHNMKIINYFTIFLLYAVFYSSDIILIKMGVDFRFGSWIRNVLILLTMVILSGLIQAISYSFEVLLCVLFFSCQSLCSMMLQGVQYVAAQYQIQNDVQMESALLRTTITNSAIVVAQILLFAFMLWLIRKQLDKCAEKLQVSELLYLIIIPVVGILIVNIIMKVSLVNQTVNSERQFFLLYETYPVFRWLIPVVSVLIYLGIYMSLRTFAANKKLYEEKENYFMEQQQVHAIMERTREVEQFYNGIRRMRHEMRNHLTAVQGLARSGAYEEIDEYLARIGESLDEFEFIVKTGNPVTDVIVNDKMHMAKEQQILFESQFVYPDSDYYNAYDIGIIVNNLLLNAIEACVRMNESDITKPQKYIVLSGKKKGKFFLIEVRNSFNGEIVFDNKTGLPITSKKNQEGTHGIGLANVKQEAEKYLGNISVHCDNNEFCVTVMLQEYRG